MKNKKSKHDFDGEVNVLITKCEKKGNINQDISQNTNNSIKNVRELTNTEDIKDFYAYTKECLRRFGKIIPPTNEELEKIYIESFPFDEELKRTICCSFLDKKLAVFDLDETLVHCLTKNIQKAQVQLTISSFNSKVIFH